MQIIFPYPFVPLGTSNFSNLFIKAASLYPHKNATSEPIPNNNKK